MKTENLRANQLSTEGYAWYGDYLAAMDARDVDAYVVFLADDCEMLFNNEPPTVGKDAIRGRLEGYWKSFASIEHDLLNIYGDDQAFVLEALNAYVRLDGRPVTCRAVAFTAAMPRGW